LLGKELFEPVETGVPELLVFQEPTSRVAERLWREGESIVAAATRTANETGFLQYANVLAKSGERHGKGLGKIGNASGTAGKAVEDGAAGGIGNGAEDAIESGRRIVNHLVQYMIGA
jgi:hypothetical protein